MKQAKQQTQDTAPNKIKVTVMKEPDGYALFSKGKRLFNIAWDSYEKAAIWANQNDYNVIGGIEPATPQEQAEGLIRSGMKVRHKLIKETLTVVADEKGPAYTGEEFKDDEISLPHAITEYKNGNLTIEQAEGFTGGDWICNKYSPCDYGIYSDIGNGADIAIVRSGGRSEEEAEANAALLVQAKNMYYALLDAKSYLYALLSWQTEKEKEETIKGEISKIQAIINAATPQ